MKKVIALLLTFIMVLAVFAGCSANKPQAKNEPQTRIEKIKAAGKLVMATDAAWPPFEYIGANGEVSGSDIDLARDIAEGLGVKLEIINASFDTLSTYIESGEADVILAAMTITEERKLTFDFSVPYTVAQQYIIVKENNNDVSVVEDMAGYKIGTHLGTTGDFLICDAIDLDDGALNGTGASYAQYKALPDAALDLNNGKLEAIVCDVLMAKNLVSVNEGLKCFELFYADGTGTSEEYGVAAAKGDAEFIAKINEIISPLVADGTIDGYIVKHTEIASKMD
ncbi:MAG: transporter substrate-binding domain-containing protein [Clostridiales bacterium]|nr:transporter substrate-binding domain-containing protein [Clostridiales bacterium]